MEMTFSQVLGVRCYWMQPTETHCENAMWCAFAACVVLFFHGNSKSKHKAWIFRNGKLINAAAFHEDTSCIFTSAASNNAPPYFWPTNYKLVHFVRCAVHNWDRSGLCAHERVSYVVVVRPVRGLLCCVWLFRKAELSCRQSQTVILLLRSRWH